ncbi:hypothetical protein B0H10DRAFT_1962792 [Mycena sp. CBHHK59/15]|nr:hypothetical protein B0H10DRAFT_1962792 [Mycena sp. CBHHK59/15]
MPNPKREIAGDCGQPGLPLPSRLKIRLLDLGKEFQMVGTRRPQKRISSRCRPTLAEGRAIKGSLVESNRLTVRLEKQATLLRRRRTAADGTDSNWWLLVWGMEKICTGCGSLVDPTTYVLQYDTWALLAPKALKTGHNHYISGHGKEARDNKNHCAGSSSRSQAPYIRETTQALYSLPARPTAPKISSSRPWHRASTAGAHGPPRRRRVHPVTI